MEASEPRVGAASATEVLGTERAAAADAAVSQGERVVTVIAVAAAAVSLWLVMVDAVVPQTTVVVVVVVHCCFCCCLHFHSWRGETLPEAVAAAERTCCFTFTHSNFSLYSFEDLSLSLSLCFSTDMDPYETRKDDARFSSSRAHEQQLLPRIVRARCATR